MNEWQLRRSLSSRASVRRGIDSCYRTRSSKTKVDRENRRMGGPFAPWQSRRAASKNGGRYQIAGLVGFRDRNCPAE